MVKPKWGKAYEGPFTKKQALKLKRDFLKYPFVKKARVVKQKCSKENKNACFNVEYFGEQ